MSNSNFFERFRLDAHELRVGGRLLVALAGAFSVGASFGGAELYQKGDVFAVSNDTAVTQSEPIRLTFDAQGVEKSGAGTYTLPRGTVDGKNPFSLRVRDGRVVLTAGGSQPTEAVPTDLLNLATFWVDASVNTVTNAAGAVMTWYDCRETATEGEYGTTYCRATTVESPTDGSGKVYAPVMPKVATPPDGTRPMVNFGGMTTGTGMTLRDSYSAVRHIFAVVDFQVSYGFFLGAPGGTQPILHPSNYGSTGVTGYYANSDTEPQTLQGEFLVNGVRCNPMQTRVRPGLQLIELHADSHTPIGAFGRFFNDRGIGGRNGGDFIGEVLVYNSGKKALSVKERYRIERYLMEKWGITPPQGAVAAKLAKGAAIEAESPNVFSTLAGQGVFAKSGSGSAVFRPVAENRMTGVSVAVENGTLIADVRELYYAPKAGETISETADQFARRTVTSSVDPANAALGRVEFTGGSVGVRIGDLEANVTNLVSDSQQTILGSAGLGGAAVAPGYGVATIANASFETAFSANDWVTETTGGDWTARITLEDDAQVEDWRVGNPEAQFRQDCRHARFYAPDGKVVLCLHNQAVVRGKVTVPADGDYLFGFEATGRYTYDNEDLTFSLIDEANKTNTFASCVIKYGDGFRPYRLPVRGLKAGRYTLRIAGQKHYSDRGYYDSGESFAHIDNLTLVQMADSSAVVGAVPVPNGSFEVTQFTTFDRRVETFSNGGIDCAGWTFSGTSSNDDDVAPLARYMAKNYVAQSNPYGEWELQFNGDAGRATTDAFSIPAGRWRLRCKAVKWGFEDNSWRGLSGRNVNPVVGVKVMVNGTERCDMLSAQIDGYDFTTVTFGTTIEVAATDRIVLEVRQNTPNGTSAAANLKVDDFEFVPESAAGELVKNGSFESGDNYWTRCSAPGGIWWVQSLSDTPDNNWGNYRFLGNDSAFFTKQAACSQAIDFPKAGVYRLSFWARSRASNYNILRTWEFGGGIVRASLIDAESRATTIVETPRLFSTNFLETAALFRIPAAGTYTLKLEGLDTADRTSAVDAVSVLPVADASAPNVSERLNLRLAADSKLRLDYDGEVRVDRLRIGNQKFYGTVDASDPSGLITGIGRLVVTGLKPGTVLIIR